MMNTTRYIKAMLCLFFVFAGILSASGQSTDIVKVVQKQLNAYNAQDLDAFVQVFAENAEVFMNLGDTAPALVGRSAIKSRYGELFEKNPTNKSTLLGRIVQGNYVFDHELLTSATYESRIVAIYEVKDGLIQRCWFVR